MATKYISKVIFKDGLDESSYLNDLSVIKHLKHAGELDLSADVTFFVGENGTGKSTLLEAIAVAYGFNAEGGSKNFSFSTRSTHSELFKQSEDMLRTDFSFAQKAYTTSLPILTIWTSFRRLVLL